MGREASKQWLKNHLNERYFTKKEAKFELVGCPVSGIYCSKILPEINALYNDSESAHINKEYTLT
jgi:hypothetical protein